MQTSLATKEEKYGGPSGSPLLWGGGEGLSVKLTVYVEGL